MAQRNDKRTLYEGRHVNLVARGTWEYAERRKVTGIVCIVPVTDDGEIILVEQYRPPVARPVVELPAGLAGDLPGTEDETLEVAARRELIEETGYEAAELEFLFRGVASAGITDEELSYYLATGLRQIGSGGGDDSESIGVHRVSLAEIEAWLDRQTQRGAAIDAKIYIGLYFVLRHRRP